MVQERHAALLPAFPLAVVAAWRNAGYGTDLERDEVTLTGSAASVVDRSG